LIVDANGNQKKSFWINGEHIQDIQDGDFNAIQMCCWRLGVKYSEKVANQNNFKKFFSPPGDDEEFNNAFFGNIYGNTQCNFMAKLKEFCQNVKINIE
jgi:hypothetical protein